MIVVRNWGNMALSTDLAWASAVQHAVEMLEVSSDVPSTSTYCMYPWLTNCNRSSILLSVDTMDVVSSRQTPPQTRHTLGRSMTPSLLPSDVLY